MKTLLVMTVGRTDVQLVINDQRFELNRKNCGELHDNLKQRGYAAKPAPNKKEKPPLDTLPEGDLSVCTPKLDAVLRFFGDSFPAHALIFDTRRETPSDPRLAGQVLKELLEKLGVQANCCTFLAGKEWLEDRSNEIDAVVRRDIVKSLNSAISQKLDETNFDRIVIAATGGLPPVNDVVKELVRLHAVGRALVTSLEIPDGAFASQDDRAVEEKFHPAAGYSARRHALSLVEKGNLFGAWGAVSQLEGAPGQEWTKVIDWLRRFASSLPMPSDCDISVLKHPRMAVRAALRVELALRAGDIPRAVHGTVAFFESALWDHILARFDRTGDKKRSLDILRLKTGVPAPTCHKLLRNDEPDEKKKKNCPFEHLDDDTYLFFEDGAGRFARDYVKSCSLKALSDTVDKVKPLRNDVAHNEPTPELMDDARGQMQKAGLWSEENTFLSQPLVQDVLRELDKSDPENLLENLLACVRQRLIEPSPVGSPCDILDRSTREDCDDC